MRSFTSLTKHVRSGWHHVRWHSARQKPGARLVDVAVGGSGNVRLDIIPPLHGLSKKSNILVYLPSGVQSPFDSANATSDNARRTAVLSTLLPDSTIITLNYRLCPPTHTFPLPIHDTVTAFNHLLRAFNGDGSRKISLFGCRIGGTLATTLALTSPNSIHSVAISDAILDWVGLDTGSEETSDPAPSSTRKTQPAPPTAADTKSLLTLRSSLFPKPDNYFDSFASPTLFLRAPGRDCLHPYSETPPEALALSYHHNTHLRSPHPPHTSSSGEGDPALLSAIKRRKVLRRWPPNGPPESARLPHFRVFVSDDQQGEGRVLRQQGEELVELMRKVCFYGWGGEIAKERVGLQLLVREEKERTGGGGRSEEEAAAAAGWLAQTQDID